MLAVGRDEGFGCEGLQTWGFGIQVKLLYLHVSRLTDAFARTQLDDEQ